MYLVNRTPAESVFWPFLSATLLLSVAGWTWISGEFVYGQGHTERPILSFLLLYLLGWGSFLGGFLLLRRSGGRGPGWLIVATALLARALLLPSSLIQENDVYRYVLDGHVVLAGENPYRHAPLVVPDLGSPHLQAELQAPQARRVLSRIGYPEIPTVYPPAAQYLFTLGAWLFPWDWMGQRWVFLALDLGVFSLLLLLLRHLRLPSGWILLYGWNPLLLKETLNSVHMDILILFFLALTLWALLGQRRSFSWEILAGAFFGLAILAKLYPLLLAPAFLLFLARKGKSSFPSLRFAASAGLVALCGLIPFLDVGMDRLTAGLRVYSREWVMNEGAFGILASLSSQPRLLLVVGLAAAAVLLPLLRRDRSPEALLGTLQPTLLFWFFWLPAAFPWYAVPLAALATLRPWGRETPLVIFLSGVLAVYYLHFYYDYHAYPPEWWKLTRLVEHSLLWALGLYLGLRSGWKTLVPRLPAFLSSGTSSVSWKGVQRHENT